MFRIIALVIAITVPVLAGYLGLTKALGAHIWWDVKTMWIGAPIGGFLALAARFAVPFRFWHVVALSIGALISFGVAKYGQTTFAASYAEDALAGRFWYFGWIATGAFAAAAIFAGISFVKGNSD